VPEVTLTVMVQVPPPVIEPPVRLIVPAPAGAEKVPLPQLLLFAFDGVATTMFVGNVSLTPTPLSAVPALGLVIVSVRVDVPPTKIGVGLKPLVIVGGEGTVNVAEAVRPVPPLVELTVPVVLAFEPPVAAVTLTDTTQLPLALIEPPVRLIVPEPAVAVKVPPQVFVAFGVPATCKPLGNVSLTATPVSAVLALGLVIVRVRVEVPPTKIDVGRKALPIVGGLRAATKLAVIVLLLPPPLAAVNEQGLVVPVHAAVPVVLQLLKT
jgi:hypothetical protein